MTGFFPRSATLAGAALLFATSLAAAPVAQAQYDGIIPVNNAIYVALGDSYTSTGSPVAQDIQLSPLNLRPLFCQNHKNNPPAMVHAMTGVKTIDASCAGAKTEDISAAQAWVFVPPQIDSVPANATHISIGLGGNDAGFTEIGQACAALAQTNRQGNPCEKLMGNWAEQHLRSMYTGLSEVVDAVRQKAPHARIVLTGYLSMFDYGRNSACKEAQFIATGDRDFVKRFTDSINATILRVAEEKNVLHTVTSVPVGHDTCATPAQRYVSTLGIDTMSAPAHPTSLGAAYYAAHIAQAFGWEIPADYQYLTH